jgi:hypothetical protein
LHNEELQNLCPSPDTIRQIKSRIMMWVRLVACMREERKLYKSSTEELEGKRPLGSPRRRWEDGIRMDLRETGRGVWSGFSWLRICTDGGLLLTR